MTTMKVIKTEQDYENALERIENLMSAVGGSPEADELELLATLVENYEEEAFPIEAPSPIAAINFRMEQAGLSARDLEPYLGSRARVSEVLSGKRNLSIDMIRNLVRHLNIPAESLLGEEVNGETFDEPSPGIIRKLKSWDLMRASEQYSDFIGRIWAHDLSQPMLRATTTERTSSRTDRAALNAWCFAALAKSEKCTPAANFDPNSITEDWLRHIAGMSLEADGIGRVSAAAAEVGVIVVMLPHFSGTYVDGAAICRGDGVPVVALSARHDRLDNYWFTLLHELAHVKLHLTKDRPAIFDDLDIRGSSHVEKEADELAQQSLIPPHIWAEAGLTSFASTAELFETASRANVHVSIVAGRWQRTFSDYKKFSKLLVRNCVREQFPELFSS